LGAEVAMGKSAASLANQPAQVIAAGRYLPSL
jgi:hypothetical protein